MIYGSRPIYLVRYGCAGTALEMVQSGGLVNNIGHTKHYLMRLYLGIIFFRLETKEIVRRVLEFRYLDV